MHSPVAGKDALGSSLWTAAAAAAAADTVSAHRCPPTTAHCRTAPAAASFTLVYMPINNASIALGKTMT